ESCLEKVPADRPESADSVVASLQRLADALTSPSSSVRTAQQARSGRRWKIVSAIAVAIAAIAIAWRWLWPGAGDDAALRTLRPFVTSAADELDSRVSPDGQWVAFISSAGNVAQVMVQQVGGGESRPVTVGAGTPESLTWSANGRELACVLYDRGHYSLNVYPAFFGGTPVSTLPFSEKASEVSLLRWIGRTLFIETKGEAGVLLERIDLDSGNVVNVSASWKLAATLTDVDVRPDGQKAAIILSDKGRRDLWTLNLDGS